MSPAERVSTDEQVFSREGGATFALRLLEVMFGEVQLVLPVQCMCMVTLSDVQCARKHTLLTCFFLSAHADIFVVLCPDPWVVSALSSSLCNGETFSLVRLSQVTFFDIV